MISLKFFVMTSVQPLAVIAAISLLAALGTTRRLIINRVGIELSFIFGGIFFLLAFLSAVIDDVRRNWKTQEPSVAWNPQLLWRNFIYLGAVGLHRGFLGLSPRSVAKRILLGVLDWALVTAKKCF